MRRKRKRRRRRRKKDINNYDNQLSEEPTLTFAPPPHTHTQSYYDLLWYCTP